MKYRNAADILPDKLIREIQKYVSGEILYVPSQTLRKKWGQDSGARQFYITKNEEIRQKHFHKKSMEDLAEEYCLSIDTIKKIVFK